MKAEPKAKRPTKAKLARLVELREKKRSLESEARQFEKEINLLDDDVLSYMEEQNKTSAKINGFQVTIEEGRPYVSWKEQFVRHVDSETAAVLMADAPRPPRVKVQPV